MGMGLFAKSQSVAAAARHGYALVGLSSPDGNWITDDTDGVVNAANPQPCGGKDLDYW